MCDIEGRYMCVIPACLDPLAPAVAVSRSRPAHSGIYRYTYTYIKYVVIDISYKCKVYSIDMHIYISYTHVKYYGIHRSIKHNYPNTY